MPKKTVEAPKKKRGRPPKVVEDKLAKLSRKEIDALDEQIALLQKKKEKLTKKFGKASKPVSLTAAKKRKIDYMITGKEPAPKKEKKARGAPQSSDSKKQINLVITLLRQAPQSRETLAKAIKRAGLGTSKNKPESDIKNYVSVMLTKIKEKYVLRSPKRGIYFIKGKKKFDE